MRHPDNEKECETMTWVGEYPKSIQPALTQIAEYIGSPLWQELCDFVESNYGTLPKVEFSICSGAPGWNVKYKKGSRALCTLYPHEGFFTCLVCIGTKEATEAEFVVSAGCSYIQDLYQKTKPFNGTRWLMIDVTSADILADAESLLFTREKPKREKRKVVHGKSPCNDLT